MRATLHSVTLCNRQATFLWLSSVTGRQHFCDYLLQKADIISVTITARPLYICQILHPCYIYWQPRHISETNDNRWDAYDLPKFASTLCRWQPCYSPEINAGRQDAFQLSALDSHAAFQLPASSHVPQFRHQAKLRFNNPLWQPDIIFAVNSPTDTTF